MRKFSLLVACVGLFGLASVQAASTNALSVSIQITAAIQKKVSATNSGVVTTAYTTTAAKIGNAEILRMISAEFATQFPAGAQLGYGIGNHGGFQVLNPNGDLILEVSTNPADSGYGFTLSNNVLHAGSPQIFVGKEVNNQNTTNDTYVATISQPDYGVFYQDSHGNNFHFIGLLVEKANAVIVGENTTYKTIAISLGGAGGGSFFNAADGNVDTAVFTTAKFTGSGKNIIQ